MMKREDFRMEKQTLLRYTFIKVNDTLSHLVSACEGDGLSRNKFSVTVNLIEGL